MAQRGSSLYSVVLEGPHGDAADALRYYHAEEALADPHWRQVYDRVADGVLGFPENLPRITRQLRTIPAGAELNPEHHLLGVPWADANECATLLAQRAESLGVPSTVTPIDTDRVAAVIGAHLWCAALGVGALTRAAALGHDAVSSVSAILARALGEGAVFTATLPSGSTHPVYQLEYLDSVIGMCHTKAQNLLGDEQALEVLRLVAHDLSYRAVGGSLTYQAAVRVRDYLMALTPNSSQTDAGQLRL